MAKVVEKGVVKAEPLNLDKFLGEAQWNRIKLIGIELEGAWEGNPAGQKVVRDGSVFKEAGDDGGVRRATMPGLVVGEIQLGPMVPAGMTTLMRKVYPKLLDPSCGLHVHMSFSKVLHYRLLMIPEYPETILYYLTRWAEKEKLPKEHPIWARLKGNSEFCQNKFWPDAQMQTRVKDWNKERYGHRYTVVHFGWERQRTVEVRVLPMFKEVEQALSAIKMVLNVTNATLLHVSKTFKRNDSGVLSMPNGDLYEEQTQEIVK